MSRQYPTLDRIAARQAQWRVELPDVNTVGMAILGRARWITQAVSPAIEAVFARYGLDRGEFDVVATLLRSGPPYRMRPTELFRSLMISSGGLTDRLNRLSRAGLVSRVPSQEDARSTLVALTEQGRSVAEKAFREDMGVEAGVLACLSSKECGQLARLLSKLTDSIESKRSTDTADG